MKTIYLFAASILTLSLLSSASLGWVSGEKWHFYNRARFARGGWRSVWYLNMRPKRIIAANYNLQVAARATRHGKTELRFSFFYLDDGWAKGKKTFECCRSHVIQGKVLASRLLTPDGSANVEIRARESGLVRIQNFFIDAHMNGVYEDEPPH